MVYKIEFYALLPNIEIYFFFHFELRLDPEPDPNPKKKVSDPHPTWHLWNITYGRRRVEARRGGGRVRIPTEYVVVWGR